MQKITLLRNPSKIWGTAGAAFYDGDQEICKSIELPWKNNRSCLSCIPCGQYVVKYIARSASGKYKDVYHVTNVKGRSGILIHKANYAGDSELGLRTHLLGCIAPVTRFGMLAGQMAGLTSAGALRKLHAVTGRKDFILEVQNNGDTRINRKRPVRRSAGGFRNWFTSLFPIQTKES